MQYELLCFYFKDVAAKAYSYEWKRAAFFKFNASTKKTNPCLMSLLRAWTRQRPYPQRLILNQQKYSIGLIAKN